MGALKDTVKLIGPWWSRRRAKRNAARLEKEFELVQVGHGTVYIRREDYGRLQGTEVAVPPDRFGHTQLPTLYCPKCRNEAGRPLPLQGLGDEHPKKTTHKCVGCKQHFFLATDRDLPVL